MCELYRCAGICGDGADGGACSIVGKGNHSINHVQKIKPRVEQVCHELGLQYSTEENAGRIYINLQGGLATMPPVQQGGGGGGYGGGVQSHGAGEQHSNRPHQGGQYHQNHGGYQQSAAGYQGQGQQNMQEEEIEEAVKKYLPRILRKLSSCCTVM